MTKRTTTAADELAAVLPPRPKVWFDKLAEDVQRDLLEIRRRFHAGEYPGRPKTFIAQWCADRFGLKINRGHFTLWLSQGGQDDQETTIGG